ncbi:group 1 glycosyl transferase [Stutzerimonas stutzeri TS44]|nr:group 1 glycosyl transferase [Stutzerimonas stutzeri TS44]
MAIDTEFYSPGESRLAESDYFFAVTWTSRTNVIRKGLIPTIEAFAEVAKNSSSLRLVVAGKHGDYLDELKSLAQRLGVVEKIEFVGMISDEEKLEYYRKCLAYVQPTLYEGFGHAIGEALACGARVITSPRGAVPEVAGEFAYWVQPDSQKEIAAAMEMVVATPVAEGEAQARHQWISSNYSIASRRAALKSVLDSLSPEKKG